MEVSYKSTAEFVLTMTAVCAFFCGGSVTPSPSQITALRFDQVREIYTDDFYGSRRGFINMSWDRPNGMSLILEYYHVL